MGKGLRRGLRWGLRWGSGVAPSEVGEGGIGQGPLYSGQTFVLWHWNSIQVAGSRTLPLGSVHSPLWLGDLGQILSFSLSFSCKGQLHGRLSFPVKHLSLPEKCGRGWDLKELGRSWRGRNGLRP